MTCDQAQQWLLETGENAPAPPAMQHHLAECTNCSTLRESLARMDEGVRNMPLPASSPAARAAMWRRLEDRPAPTAILLMPSGVSKLPARGRRWLTAAAAILLFALGILVGRNIGTNRGRPTDDESPQAEERKPIDLRILEYVVALSSATDDVARIELLGDMASELLAEAADAIERHELNRLPLVTELYSRLVNEGLVRLAASLPADKRATAVAALVKELREAEREISVLAKDALPAVADLLRPLQAATHDGADLLEAGKTGPVAGPRPVTLGQPLVADLVDKGLRLATERNPIRRADLSAELSPRLATAVVHLSVQGAEAQAEELEFGLAQLMENGVVSNLEHADPPIDKPERARDMDRLRQKAAQALEVLERNLAGRPVARDGLQRAVEACKGNPPKGPPIFRGGPPWRPPTGRMPPGWGKPPKWPGPRR